MQCKSCKEVIDDKFQAALVQNICPICGKEIYTFSKAEYTYRKKLSDILIEFGIDNTKSENVTDKFFTTSQDLFKPIETVVYAPQQNVKVATEEVPLRHSGPRVKIATEEVPLMHMGGGGIDDGINIEELENELSGEGSSLSPTSDEAREVQEMLNSGEIT